MKIDLTYAIDLTISNGDHQRPTDMSMHRLVPRYDGVPLSMYSRIISELGSKLDGYLKSDACPATLGFGGKLGQETEAR